MKAFPSLKIKQKLLNKAHQQIMNEGDGIKSP